MKYMIILVALVFSGCSVVGDIDTDKRTPVSTNVYPALSGVDAISNYIQSNIAYDHYGNGVRWSAEKTMLFKIADNEDAAILFMDIAYNVFGEQCELIVADVSNDKNSIFANTPESHYLVEINGNFYDPFRGTVFTDFNVKESYSFDEVFGL